MSEPIEELLAQTTNKTHSLCQNSNAKDALEQNYVYAMEVLQRQHSEHVIQLQRQHKDHVEHLERQVAQLERQVQLLQHHLLRRP
jgi:hypothetical protein